MNKTTRRTVATTENPEILNIETYNGTALTSKATKAGQPRPDAS